MSKTSMLTTVLTLALLAPTSGVLADGQQTLASTMDVYAFGAGLGPAAGGVQQGVQRLPRGEELRGQVLKAHARIATPGHAVRAGRAGPSGIRA
jgi:hypothetical protein